MFNLDPIDLLGELLRGSGKEKPRAPEPREKDSDITDRRDERGVPYRGDFPNPASDKTRGCF